MAKFVNHNLKETTSTVLQRLLIKNVVTVIPPNPIQSNPIHGWIQSMSNSGALTANCTTRCRLTD